MPKGSKSPGNAFDISSYVQKKNVEIWPENWESFRLFMRLSTQWRVGMSGATGLDYVAVYPLIDKIAKDDEEWYLILDDIQTMESEALRLMAQQNAP